MDNYITLVGAEQVQSAASTIRHAAEDMRSAASNMDSSFREFRQYLDDWLFRFQQIMESSKS